MLLDLKKTYPDKISFFKEFDEPLAHQIYAGSDFFLMPSIYEPCGLSQMISFCYGTIPIVYHTGGLVDTVMPFDIKTQHGDGFVFAEYNEDAFVKVVKKAVKAFQDKEMFYHLIVHVMKYDFSWATSAKEYKNLYSKCLSSD
jgi:starch synthase